MPENTQTTPNHKARALEALADASETLYNPTTSGAHAQVAGTHAILAVVEQLEVAVSQFRRLADAQEFANKQLFGGGIYGGAR